MSAVRFLLAGGRKDWIPREESEIRRAPDRTMKKGGYASERSPDAICVNFDCGKPFRRKTVTHVTCSPSCSAEWRKRERRPAPDDDGGAS